MHTRLFAKYAVRTSSSFLPEAPVDLYDASGLFLGVGTVGAYSHILCSKDSMSFSLQGTALRTREQFDKA